MTTYRGLALVCLALASVSSVQGAFGQERFLGNIFTGLPDPLFERYWNQITPENAGKWGSVEVARNNMSWATLDLIYAYAAEHDMPVKQHTFIWGQQEPTWLQSLPPEAQRAEVEQWLTLYAERYPEVAFIDVVNEPLHALPSYKEAIGGDGETGWDWVIWAFERARALFPDAKLLINEYNILCCADELERYRELIALLHARGLIDGVGVQGHGLEEVPPDTIRRNLDRLAELGLPIYVSELDLNSSSDARQRELYESIFPILWEHEAVRGVTLWGYKAGEIWRPDAYLVDWFGEERPALKWLEGYLEAGSAPSTQ